MIRATTILLWLAAPAASLAAPQGPGLEAYLAAVDRAEMEFDAACANLRAAAPPPGRVWLRLGPNGVELAPADAAAAEAAAFWAEAALGARAAAEALYGRAAGAGLERGPIMIETSTGDGGVAVHDGRRRSEGDPCDALRRLTTAFGGASGAPGASPFDAARDLAAAPEGVALAIGGAATADIEPPPPGAMARGPDGVTATITDGEEGARLRIEANGDAAPGEASVNIYDPADPFRPVETVALTILPGAAPAPTAGSGALAPGGAVEGRVARGDGARLTVELAEDGPLTLSSAPGPDLAARLENAEGRTIASDDDSGKGYGFVISADLPAGTYFLTVNHCCGGGGAFTVTARSK